MNLLIGQLVGSCYENCNAFGRKCVTSEFSQPLESVLPTNSFFLCVYVT